MGTGGNARRGAMQVVGLGALNAWMCVAFFSNVVHFSQNSGFDHLSDLYGYWCLGIVAMSALGVVPWAKVARMFGLRGWGAPNPDGDPRVGLRPAGDSPQEAGGDGSLPRRGGAARPHARRLVSAAAAAAVLSLCTCLLLYTNGDKRFESLCFTVSLVAGAAVCVLYWSWGLAFVQSIGRYLAAYLAGACAVGAALYVAAHLLPDGVAQALAVALPLASVACLAAGRFFEGGEHAVRPVSEHGKAIFARALVAVLLVGFAEGSVRAVFQSEGVVFDPGAYQWVVFAAALTAAVLIICVARFRPGRDSIGRVNYVIMLVIVFLFLLAPVVFGLGYAADVTTMTCFFLFYLFVWTALLQIVSFYRLRVRSAFGAGLGVAYLGCWVGSHVGTNLAPLAAANYRVQIAFALGCAVLVLVAMLFVANERTFVELLNADDESPTTPRRFALRCDRVAQLYGLTPKETEVMTLVAKGRSVQRIQEALGVTASTVNTHVNHIYRKLDVHSRQEMLDLLERGEG